MAQVGVTLRGQMLSGAPYRLQVTQADFSAAHSFVREELASVGIGCKTQFTVVSVDDFGNSLSLGGVSLVATLRCEQNPNVRSGHLTSTLSLRRS